MTPVEAVARAICDENFTDPDLCGPGYCEDDRYIPNGKLAWEVYVYDAKAAIRALAENVTDEMMGIFDFSGDVRDIILAALEEE